MSVLCSNLCTHVNMNSSRKLAYTFCKHRIQGTLRTSLSLSLLPLTSLPTSTSHTYSPLQLFLSLSKLIFYPKDRRHVFAMIDTSKTIFANSGKKEKSFQTESRSRSFVRSLVRSLDRSIVLLHFCLKFLSRSIKIFFHISSSFFNLPWQASVWPDLELKCTTNIS